MWRSKVCKEIRRPIWGWRADQRWLCVPPASWKCQGNNSISVIIYDNSISCLILEPRGRPPSCCLQDLAESGMSHPHTGLQVSANQTNDTTYWSSKALYQDKMTDQRTGYRHIDQSVVRIHTLWPIKAQCHELMTLWPADKRNVNNQTSRPTSESSSKE